MNFVANDDWRAVKDPDMTVTWSVLAYVDGQPNNLVADGLSEGQAKLIAAAPQLAALLGAVYRRRFDGHTAATDERIEAVMAEIGGPDAWDGRAR